MMVMVHFSRGARFDCRYIHMASALYDGGFLQQKRSEKRVDYFRRKKEKSGVLVPLLLYFTTFRLVVMLTWFLFTLSLFLLSFG